MPARMVARMAARMTTQTHARMLARMDVCMDHVWTHGCMHGCMNACMDAWMYAWVHGCMHRCMDASQFSITNLLAPPNPQIKTRLYSQSASQSTFELCCRHLVHAERAAHRTDSKSNGQLIERAANQTDNVPIQY